MIDPRPSRPIVGILWMLFSGIAFIAVNALVKFMGPRMPAAEAAFLRYLMGIVFLVPLLPQMLNTKVTSRLWGLFAARGIFHAFGVMLWFYAMARIPLADVTALNYLSPVFVTIGAALFLGEKLAIRRIAAIFVALVGTFIIVRPGMREVGMGQIAMLGAAFVFGGSYLLAKVTVDKSSPALVVGMLSLWVPATLAPFAWAVWVPPTWEEIGILLAVAFFATAGHYMMTLAFAEAPMTVTQPVTFLQLVWATLLGAVAFAEPVDIWVVTGGTLVVGAVTFITWREAVLKRRLTPPSPATGI